MIRAEIQKGVYECIGKLALVDVVQSNDKNLFDDLGFDSLDCVELIMDLEDKFDIEIRDDEAEKCQTVNDVINVVGGKLS